MSRVFVGVAALVAAGAFALAADAAGSDPRVCGAATPGGASQHAYYCAGAAADHAVRVAMSRRTHQARWFAPVKCTERTLLRWSCVTVAAGATWQVAVVFVHGSAGWTSTVTVRRS